MTENVVASRCSCMQLCSQGPHLWPLYHHRLRVSGTMKHTDRHCGSEKAAADSLLSAPSASSAGTLWHNVLNIIVSSKMLTFLWRMPVCICVMYVYYQFFCYLSSMRFTFDFWNLHFNSWLIRSILYYNNKLYNQTASSFVILDGYRCFFIDADAVRHEMFRHVCTKRTGSHPAETERFS